MLLLLATFAACSYASKHQKTTQSQKNIYIRCIGACAEHQEVELPCGVQISDLLAKIRLTEDADISKLILEERLVQTGVFIVPSKGRLSLCVTGAVERPGIIYVPEGLRFNQLKHYLALADNADAGMFNRRRRILCEGETIHVPAKSEYIVRK